MKAVILLRTNPMAEEKAYAVLKRLSGKGVKVKSTEHRQIRWGYHVRS